ncbi:hypothetical protein AGABI2DRAFT_190177 [Agaricus bisporus var. bisporus H97]|uniref:hypothetical protein n=1 Tax=Agaricus bisporus var. bisporus (strain H97 / ATCC MYA-4626 / FGSC 10389) TaxID=936046 RepID=UPI00029F71C8|nr:hypothetical protein AGABI2DRAFT_190177 [Agaricus bisporus var. bisporus H97]EKV49702.1 hypothetical protein AGABI2DRAFT_190177 [Agaricus bisporus var. bisporus H97]
MDDEGWLVLSVVKIPDVHNNRHCHHRHHYQRNAPMGQKVPFRNSAENHPHRQPKNSQPQATSNSSTPNARLSKPHESVPNGI